MYGMMLSYLHHPARVWLLCLRTWVHASTTWHMDWGRGKGGIGGKAQLATVATIQGCSDDIVAGWEQAGMRSRQGWIYFGGKAKRSF